MAAVVEDKPVAQTEFTKDLIALFEANLRNSEECLGPYLDHAAKTWRVSVEWASNQIPRRGDDPNFDSERDRRVFELAKEIFVKLMLSFSEVEARTWKELEHWSPRNVKLSPTEKRRGGTVDG